MESWTLRDRRSSLLIALASYNANNYKYLALCTRTRTVQYIHTNTGKKRGEEGYDT